MKSKLKTVTWVLSLSFVMLTSNVYSENGAEIAAQIKAVLELPHRSEENRARDKNRAAEKAMTFCRLQSSHTVLEFGPGGGWYSEILGPVLKDNGQLIIATKDKWMEKLQPLLEQAYMSSSRTHALDIDWNSENKNYHIGEISYPVTDADLALNIREYHNFDTEGAQKMNQATFDALKPGGLYCIIDHTRRHMEPRYFENRRRADPVEVILQVQAAGFLLVDSSNLFFKPDDELRYEVGRKSVAGNTDRFSLLFQKPPN